MVRRVHLLMLAILILTPLSTIGQEDIKPRARFFSMPKNVRSEDFRSGVINIKVKPEYRNLFRTGRFSPKAIAILNELGFESLKPIVAEKNRQNLNMRLQRKPTYDIGLYQQLRYNGNIPMEQAINLLYSSGIVDLAEPEYIEHMDFIPDDSLLYRQYYLELLRAFEAWDLSTGDTSVVIAIVDSGIDTDHPDLKGNLWINPNDPVDGIDNDGNGYIDDINGWDFAGAVSNFEDGDNDVDIMKGGGHQHGLGVASLAGAEPNNAMGIAGTGYNCRLMITKHFADDQPEDATGYNSSPYLGILYAAENGAHIINCSWGSTFRSQFNQDLINYVTLDLGVLVIASSGNSGLEEEHYPSDYDHVLSVSAIDRSLKKSSFTTYGKNVDITAPGSNIYLHEINNGYGISQGTSFSTPMVAGAAGLVKSLYPEFNGIQVGELLRVTANDTIYEVNPSSSFRNKLGKGILDMEKALTAQPPSIRMMSFRLLDEGGKTPGNGEEAYFVANFKNYLWPSSHGLTVRLTSKSGLLQVVEGESSLGIIETGQTLTNAASPFKVRILENTPVNVKVDLLLEFEDGEYSDYQFVSILLNPTYLNIEENLVTSSIAENGRIGYQDTEQNQGNGFVLNDQNLLYEMGLMLGNSSEQVSSAVRTTSGEFDEDFVSISRIRDQTPGDFSAAEILGAFIDSSAAESASNVKVNFKTMVWRDDPNDQYFMIEYNIKNEGDSTLNSFYAGLYADWDVSQEGTNIGRSDRADWDAGTAMGYVYNTDSIEQKYAGIQVLTGSSNYWAIDNDNSIEDNPWGVYDGFKDEEKYESMSSGLGRQQAGFSEPTGSDVSHTIAAGPFSIDPGDSITVAFAIHGATTLNDLIRSARAADTMYNYTLKEVTPVVPDVEICYSDSAVLTASGATSYRWYKTKTGGSAFFEGDVYITERLYDDTTFYVSNAENTWESVRTPVSVDVKANPEIILSGPQFICDGDTTILMVDNADTYLWNPGGETSRSIAVSESGIFNVTVTYDALGCVSTSEDIQIIKNSSPSASFEIDKREIDQNIDIEINMTDQSDNTSTWYWTLSDGQTSTEQNPVFTVNTIEPIEVTLTATSNEGCQDKDIQTIDVITSLEDESLLAESLKFYPNPTRGLMKIELVNEFTGDYEITIFNTMGKTVRHYTFEKTGGFSQGTVDLNGLPRGIYLLQVKQDPVGTATSKIILR